VLAVAALAACLTAEGAHAAAMNVVAPQRARPVPQNDTTVIVGTAELLNFPDCWNGNDLDSADHKAHMAYSTGGICPASHPVAVPRLEFKLRYPTSGGASVRIATGSGVHANHGGSGYSAHGDFFNAWLPGALEARIERCLWREVKCGPDGEPG